MHLYQAAYICACPCMVAYLKVSTCNIIHIIPAHLKKRSLLIACLNKLRSGVLRATFLKNPSSNWPLGG